MAADCLSPIYRYAKGSRHRVAGDKADRDALVADGWESQGVVFYAAAEHRRPSRPRPSRPDDGDTVFTFAAMPDTQQEVLRSSDTRFLNRTKWLVNQKSALDLRFATQTGDLVNWDTPEHDQYEIASAGMKPLEAANIPYTIAIGNHDTMATGVGGGARDTRMTRIYQRDTRTFNSYFTASRYTEVSGAPSSPARSTTSTPCTRPAASNGWCWCWSSGRARPPSTGRRTPWPVTRTTT